MMIDIVSIGLWVIDVDVLAIGDGGEDSLA
jgi:hypothetical protein